MEDSLRSKLDGSWCPFTWETIVSLKKDAIATENDISVIGFVHLLLNCYRHTVDGNDKKAAREHLARAKSKLEDIRNEDRIQDGIRAYEHVYYATEGHVLLQPNDLEDRKRIDDVITNMHDVSTFDDREIGALHGCKSIALSFLYVKEVDNCIAEAKEAIRLDPGNGIWKFVLAKAMRNQRRYHSMGYVNSDEERENFRIAADEYPHPCTAVFYAQALIEQYSRQVFAARPDLKERVTKIYRDILGQETRNYKTLLKIVLGSVRIHEYDIARVCLERAEELMPNRSILIHYKGEVARAEGKNEEAIQFFFEAGKRVNLPADLGYVNMLQKFKRKSPRSHLMQMLTRYNEVTEKQKILLYIADTYKHENDLANTARYFIDAIKCDPKSKILTEHHTLINFTRYREGIYNYLRTDFCPKIERTRRSPGLRQLGQELLQLVLDNM